MLSVTEAQALVLQQARPLPAQVMPAAARPLGQVLAETIASDIDLPPYDKALMDGYAVRSADLIDAPMALVVIAEVAAGQIPRSAVGPGQAVRIMTGAPIPQGADAVVMIERTKMIDAQHVYIDAPAPKPEQNILRQGRELKRGQTVLTVGALLRPQEFGVLAAVGRSSIAVWPRAQVAVVPTGDEIVDVEQCPGPGQIRNSNGPMLAAQISRAGGDPHCLGIARDRLDSLRLLVEHGLGHDMLVLSGGVSAGKLDLVPGVLEELGVQAHFHKVAMKPGKPVFFGTRSRPNGPPALVFGLPGNPVSSYVCCELFVRPALRKLAGHHDPGPRFVQAELAADFSYASDRPTYHPALMIAQSAGWRVQPRPWMGSSDLHALLHANAFVVFPPGQHQHRAGQQFPVLVVEW